MRRIITGLLVAISVFNLSLRVHADDEPNPSHTTSSTFTRALNNFKNQISELYRKAESRKEFVSRVLADTEIIFLSASWCDTCSLLKGLLSKDEKGYFIMFIEYGTSYRVPVKILETDTEGRDVTFKIGDSLFLPRAMPTLFVLYKNQAANYKVGATKSVFQDLLSIFLKSLLDSSEVSTASEVNSGKNAVILIGTGGKGLNYSSYKIIQNIQDKLASWNKGFLGFFNLYGDENGSSDVEITSNFGPLQLNKRTISVNDTNRLGAFSHLNLKKAANLTQYDKNRLWVLVGHAYSGWLPINEDKGVLVEQMKEIVQRQSPHRNDIMVSGTCYGASFYDGPTCGFFAADPGSTSSGCNSRENVDVSPYYLSLFFNAVDNKIADTNQDGKVSFIEAHNYAYKNKIDSDKPFTSLDVHAQEAFDFRKIVHEEAMSWEDFENLLVRYGTNDDVFIYREFRANAFMREFSNFKKADSFAQTPNLVLFRRVMFRKYVSENPNSKEAVILAKLDACQNRGVKEFLSK